MSILNGIRQTAQAAHDANAAPAAAASTERKPSDFWLNVGITVETGKSDDPTKFISLPQGIALDDMKPQVVRGNNVEFQQMVQTKNALLDELQKAAATLKPGERLVVPLEVELYRRAEPEQTGDASTNPLMAGLIKRLSPVTG
jgi:hypothetical protein